MNIIQFKQLILPCLMDTHHKSFNNTRTLLWMHLIISKTFEPHETLRVLNHRLTTAEPLHNIPRSHRRWISVLSLPHDQHQMRQLIFVECTGFYLKMTCNLQNKELLNSLKQFENKTISKPLNLRCSNWKTLN